MKTDRLLDCPFCGSRPIWINETIPDGHYYIKCPHCHIIMKEDRRDKVIGMWNRRDEIDRLMLINRRKTGHK
jgi:Lar family restriction alleviation protein